MSAAMHTATNEDNRCDRATRYGGNKRPFIGERFDGEARVTKKRRRERSRAPSPEIPDVQAVKARRLWINCRYQIPGTNMTEYWKGGRKHLCRTVDRAWEKTPNIQTVEARHLWINCRYQIPGTNMTEYWQRGTKHQCRTVDMAWERRQPKYRPSEMVRAAGLCD